MALMSRRLVLAGMGGLVVRPVLADAAVVTGRTLRMAYFESYAPLESRTADGAVKGLLIDAMDEIGTHTGFTLRHSAYPWARAQQMVRQGDEDGFCTTETDERKQYAAFAPTPLIVTQLGIFHRADDDRYDAVRSLDDLGAFNIGAYLGSGWTAQNLARYPVHYVKDEATVLRMIDYGNIDIYIDHEITTKSRIKELGLERRISFRPLPFLAGTSFRFGLRRSYPDADACLALVEAALQSMTASGDLAALIARYV